MESAPHGQTWVWPQPAPPDLATDVVCSWQATVQGTHRLVPDGCVDVLWLASGPVWVCGPETEAWEFTLPPGLAAVGLRFRPGSARRVLGIDVNHLTNTRNRLADLMGEPAERCLSEQLGEAPDASRLVTLEAVARRWLARSRPTDAADAAIARTATSPGPVSVDVLARTVGLSTRQVHRRSVRLFGYGPTTLMRLIRFQRCILRAQREPHRSLGELAAASGYSDQAHLARDCREIVGVPPSVFLPGHDRTFPTSDPYKTGRA